MSHFGDFMDGVPVKISEKYKRPPRIELPYSVTECTIRSQKVVDIVKYSSNFERNVLSKLKELRSIKETKKNERRHRLQLLEEVKQKKLDAIAAAEEEERLKQLSVSEVSYPSTDEISALSPDDKNDNNCDTNIDNTPEIAEVNVTNVNIPSSSTANESQLNILQPIQVKSNYEGSLLDDPDPLQTLKLNARIKKIQYNHNVDTLTYRDFENDTSSPFDNVELKTINDMELLAQVLQRESAASCHPQSFIPDQTYILPNCASQAQMGTVYLPNSYMEQPNQGSAILYSPQNYPNGYYVQDSENINGYVPNYQYYVPSNPYTNIDPTYYCDQPTTSVESRQVSNGSTYIPQPYYFQHQRPMQHQPQNTPILNIETKIEDRGEENEGTLPNAYKSRSRSVPDIVKELNEELAKLKTSDRSYNMSPAPKTIPQPSSSDDKREPSSNSEKKEKRRRKSDHLPNPYKMLSPNLQEMCQEIHAMGFPLERVARVCMFIGDSDKKVIEALLLLGEMMDLGFPEGKSLAALVENGFNKDKALDELVS